MNIIKCKNHWDVLDALTKAIEISAEAGGGAIALVGPAGVGKSVIAKQLASINNQIQYLENVDLGGEALIQKPTVPALKKISIIDEAWQYDDLTQTIAEQVRVNHGVVVVIVNNADEATQIAGMALNAIYEVPHWSKVNEPAINLH
jgi:ABC-type cobalamin/Fe3+-siderophores transport system ATPase subunit